MCEVLTDIGPTVKTALEILTQKQWTVNCEVLTDLGEIREDDSGQSCTEPRDCEVWRTDRQWRTVEDSSGQSDTESRDGTVWGTDSQ